MRRGVYRHRDRPGAGATKRRKYFGKHPRTKAQKQGKVHAVMGEFKRGKLRSGSGHIVTKRSQAQAIAMSESGQSKQKRERRRRSVRKY